VKQIKKTHNYKRCNKIQPKVLKKKKAILGTSSKKLSQGIIEIEKHYVKANAKSYSRPLA
jgi:hypothetical protein